MVELVLKLDKSAIRGREVWERAGIELPQFDVELMSRKTIKNPKWVHFGAGNILKGFIAVLQQTLLDSNKADCGIIAVETYDLEIIDRIYNPYDNLSLLVLMNADGTLEKKVIGSIAESIAGDISREGDWARLSNIFTNQSLQMVSFTITEKGYSLKGNSGEYLPDVEYDIKNGPVQPRHIMSKIASLTYNRFL